MSLSFVLLFSRSNKLIHFTYVSIKTVVKSLRLREKNGIYVQ
jgi:hypothetical protein